MSSSAATRLHWRRPILGSANVRSNLDRATQPARGNPGLAACDPRCGGAGGGVSATNMLDYFRAGASMVGVGNNIIDQKALAAGDRARVIAHARSFLDLAAKANAS